MTDRLVPFLAFVLFLMFVAGMVTRLFRSEPPPVGPSRTTLAAASEIPGTVKTPQGDGPILRVALLLPAAWGDVTAVAAVEDVALVPGRKMTVPLSLSRALLPEFAGAAFSAPVQIRVDPAGNGLAVLRLDPSGLRSGFGSGPPFVERWIVRTGEPIVRLGYLDTGALVLMLLESDEARGSDPGRLAWWRETFREAGTLPFPDEERVAAAAEELRPENVVRPWAAPAVAPLNAALGLWILGDAEGLSELRERAGKDPAFRDRAIASMARERPDEEWVLAESIFALQLLRWLSFDDDETRIVVHSRLGTGIHYTTGEWILRWSPPVRVLRLIDDPSVDRVMADVIERRLVGRPRSPARLPDWEYDLEADIGRYALAHDPPAERPFVRELWRDVREETLDLLPRTVRLRRAQPAVLGAILIAMIVAAVLFALIPRGPRPRLRIKVLPLVAIYVGSVVGVNEIQFGSMLAPVWVSLFFAWLRSDVSHPWWERAAIGIAVFSSLVRLVFQDQFEVIHPAMLTVGDAWYGFAWLVIGRIVLSMPEHTDSKAFRAFLTLHVFTVVQGTGALLTGQIDRAGPALLTTMGVAAAAFLWFSLEEPVRRLGARIRRE